MHWLSLITSEGKEQRGFHFLIASIASVLPCPAGDPHPRSRIQRSFLQEALGFLAPAAGTEGVKHHVSPGLPFTWFTVMLFTSRFEFFNTSRIKIDGSIDLMILSI